MTIKWCFEQMCAKGFTLAGGYLGSGSASAEAHLEFAQVIPLEDAYVFLWLRYTSDQAGQHQSTLGIGGLVRGDLDRARSAFEGSFFTDARWKEGEEAHVRVKLGANGVFAKPGDPWLMFHFGCVATLIPPMFDELDLDERLSHRSRTSASRLATAGARRVIEVVGRCS